MKIRYITPFSTTGNIGKALNESIEELPDDCFVVCRDGDTLFLNPHWGKLIEDIIQANPDIGLIGSMTNRIRWEWQLHNKKLSDNADIRHHYEIAIQREAEYRTEVERCQMIAGLCMIFHKSLWERVKFKENSDTFDTEFCRAVAKLGIKIGVAKGLYIWHSYRIWSATPLTDKGHLYKMGEVAK